MGHTLETITGVTLGVKIEDNDCTIFKMNGNATEQNNWWIRMDIISKTDLFSMSKPSPL